MFPDFARDHVRDLDDRSVLPVIGTRSHVLESCSSDSLQRLSNGCSIVLHKLCFRRWQIDKQDLVRYDRIWTTDYQRNNAVADTVDWLNT